MNRYKAALIHLGISALVAAVVSATIILVWFPGAYLTMANGLKLIALVVGCDVVLGPLLTLVVFNPQKKSLRFDLTVIGLIQVAALAYGVYVASWARPAFGVLLTDIFYPVPAMYIEPELLAKAQPPFNRLSWSGPVSAQVVRPAWLSLPGAGPKLSQTDPTQYLPPTAETWSSTGLNVAQAEAILASEEAKAAIRSCIDAGSREQDLRIVEFVTLGRHGKVVLDAQKLAPCAVFAASAAT